MRPFTADQDQLSAAVRIVDGTGECRIKGRVAAGLMQVVQYKDRVFAKARQQRTQISPGKGCDVPTGFRTGRRQHELLAVRAVYIQAKIVEKGDWILIGCAELIPDVAQVTSLQPGGYESGLPRSRRTRDANQRMLAQLVQPFE